MWFGIMVIDTLEIRAFAFPKGRHQAERWAENIRKTVSSGYHLFDNYEEFMDAFKKMMPSPPAT